MIAEVAASVAAAGFRRIAIVNASPWCEELCGAAARDLRVSRGLQMFQVHLSASAWISIRCAAAAAAGCRRL